MRLRAHSFLWRSGFGPAAGARRRGLRRGFTLAEMLIVLVIIALLAALVLPHIRGHTESVAINAACRQLVADFSYARQRAIAHRSTVAIVTIDPSINDPARFTIGSGYSSNEVATIKRLQGGVFTHYALYEYRKAGEQPGSHESAGYITEWKSLPDKTFFDPSWFSTGFFPADGQDPDPPKFPFPFSTSTRTGEILKHIAFDSQGRCIRVDREETGVGHTKYGDRRIHVARGGILVTRLPDGTVTDFEAKLVPPYNGDNNIIHVDFLTGKASRIELPLQ